ncbi:MAG: CubicO group peptidase (beta-lactamase class C family) [Flavobacteriaceae bacterium]|jgi:CubicO group peptidase (beta-lactamase class C family)
MKKYFLLLLLCTYSLLSFGQLKESQEIDGIFKEWGKQNVPGGAIGIIKDGELIYAKGYGIADLEHDIKISPSSVFTLGAASQQFVAFSLLLLEEQGKLNLDDTVQTYLPDFPEYDAPLTIRHFIHHTSGIRHYRNLMHLKGRGVLDKIEADEVYALIKHQKALNFLPGEKFSWSNSAYFLLAKIIKKVSGQSLREFTKEHIFDPLGMKSTLFYDDNTDLIKNRAFSYNKKSKEDGFDNLIMRFDLVGAGGAYSTIEDLYLWDQNFYTNILGKGDQQIITNMHKEGLLNNGKSSGHAYGLTIDNYKGLKTVENSGWSAGYRSEILRFPEENFSVIILANRGDANPWTMSYQVADILLKDKFIDAPKKKEKMIGNDDGADVKEKFSLKQITGNYEIEPGRLLKFNAKHNSLQLLEGWGDPLMLIHTQGNIYKEANNPYLQFVFSNLNNGLTQNLTVSDTGFTRTLIRKEKFDFSNLNLADYTGDFYSEEIDATHLLFLDDGKLNVKIANNEALALAPYSIDTFYSNGYMVHFTRTNGAISGFDLKYGWITNLKFKKK